MTSGSSLHMFPFLPTVWLIWASEELTVWMIVLVRYERDLPLVMKQEKPPKLCDVFDFHTWLLESGVHWMTDDTYGANTMSPWFERSGNCDIALRECDVRANVRCRRAWRGLKGSCPQMTCGWHRLCQTGRQVALGSHSGTWVFAHCCTNPRVHTNAHPKPAESQRRCTWGGPGSLHASSWKWLVSLSRGAKTFKKGEGYFSLT